MTDDIRDNTEQSRFELAADGALAVAHYRRAGDVITFTHTEVPPQLRSGGIASRLVRGALDAVRTEGLRVVPQCTFVAAYIERHPEFADLLEPVSPQ